MTAHAYLAGSLLIVALALAVAAERRGWAPSLRASLATGLVLRGLMLWLAVRAPAQPYDFIYDFKWAAEAVLAGKDPVLELRDGGWHFLPLLAYVFAGVLHVGDALGVPWTVAGRLVPITADLVLIVLVGRLAPEKKALRAFQYACVPLALMASSLHGQIEAVALAFGAGAFLMARRGRAVPAGLLLGLSVTSGSWPVLLIPGVLLAVGAGRRVKAFAATVVVPAVFLLSVPLVLQTPPGELVRSAKSMASSRPVVGDWGWSPWATGGAQTVSPVIGRIGLLLILCGVLAVCYLWRRADPVDLTIAILLIFVIVTARLGAQYLLWSLPFLIGRPTRFTWPAIAAAGAWAAIGYLYLMPMDTPTWNDNHVWWSRSSALAVPFLVLALPWSRRVAASDGPRDGREQREGEPAGHRPA